MRSNGVRIPEDRFRKTIELTHGLFNSAICQSGVAGGLMRLHERNSSNDALDRFFSTLGGSNNESSG
jgi:hypothetical protein